MIAPSSLEALADCAYTSTPCPSGEATAAWLTPNEISQRYGICGQTARRLIDRNAIQAVRLESGYRRVRSEDAEAYFESLKVRQEEKPSAIEEESSVFIYARVSSASQKADGERQLERLKDHAGTAYGCPNAISYFDIGSGLSENRHSFNRLFDNVLAGRHDGQVLLLEHEDRAMRFSRGLFFRVLAHHNIKVVCIGGQDSKSQQEDWATDVVLICQVYGNRLSGKRSAERTRVVLTPHQMNEAFTLHKSGYSIRDISTHFNGQASENGKKISQSVIQNLLKKNRSALEQLVDTTTAKNSFQRFEAEAIRSTSKPSLVSKQRVCEVYLEWCKANGEAPISEKNIGSYYKRKGIQTKYSRTGSLLYVGISLVTNKGN